MQRLRVSCLILAAALVLAPLGCGDKNKPTVEARINAISDDLDDLLILPPSGWALGLTFTPGNGQTIDPLSLEVLAYPWAPGLPTDLTGALSADTTGAMGLVPSNLALAAGSYTLTVTIADTRGVYGATSFSFAVRDFPSGPPIGSGQQIWLDFTIDRDGAGGADFPVDLETVGLGSAASPSLSSQVEADVIARLVARVQAAFDDDPLGLGSDPADVTFTSTDPGSGDVTRLCVGGIFAAFPSLIGSVLIDPDNQVRGGAECGTLPPTGVFSGGMFPVYSGQTLFQNTFNPLMTSTGGTPVGEHALDPIVLAAGWDPGSAPQEEIDRFDEIDTAVQVYADSLGSVVAHEAGHALGLVAPGVPGVGLHGGSVGSEYSHDVDSLGATPAETWLMNEGGSFTFAELAGTSGPLPRFRPLDYAYLRDRVVRDPTVMQLLLPPVATGVTPTLVTQSQTLTITGENFADGLDLEIENFSTGFPLLFPQAPDPSTATGLLDHGAVPAGWYWIRIINPDGQVTYAPDLVQVQ